MTQCTSSSNSASKALELNVMIISSIQDLGTDNLPQKRSENCCSVLNSRSIKLIALLSLLLFTRNLLCYYFVDCLMNIIN